MENSIVGQITPHLRLAYHPELEGVLGHDLT